ncbi:MAG TPA: hypothetical protein VGD58_18980 [Herpetosiphonaceae bacterium]
MDPESIFCPNLAYPARGHVGQGNLTIHSRKEQRYRFQVCGKTFAARTGTVFYRRRTPEAIITQVLTLISYGCPVVAIEADFHIQAQTVREWIEVAGAHTEAVHHE